MIITVISSCVRSGVNTQQTARSQSPRVPAYQVRNDRHHDQSSKLLPCHGRFLGTDGKNVGSCSRSRFRLAISICRFRPSRCW
jgi:hypothetical protein